jgi:hypothetical protein
MSKKTVIHVNQAIIKSNHKTGARAPVLTVKTYDSNTYGHQAIIYDKDGNEVARVVYNPDNPLSCGARVWVESYNRVEVIDKPLQKGAGCQQSKCSKKTSAVKS